ncbi:MAG: sulfite exporter TauE/SafE family protein [Acidobacteria bacterium]|nr:sulfite exporter TauE/SafE family protein [Acidobacteriota bacterium]
MIGVLALLTGLAFSGHCVLMCGAFPAALKGDTAGASGSRRPGRNVALQLLYHAGKTWAYVLLGVAAALAGARLQSLRLPLGVGAGALLIVAGASRLLPSSALPGVRRLLLAAPLCEAIAAMLRGPRPFYAFVVGIFNGFVPCGAVYAMLLHAAALGSLPAAGLSMLCFGLGTVPALLLVGLAAQFVRARIAARPAALRLARAAAWAPIALGVLTLWRTLGDAHAHLPPLVARLLAP